MKEFKEDYDLLDYMLILHMYAESKGDYFDIANEGDVEQLVERCTFAAEYGFDHISLGFDDWTPYKEDGYMCRHLSERRRFKNSVGYAHGYLLKQVHEALKRVHPQVELSVCPAPYSIYVHKVPTTIEHQRYLRDMGSQLPEDVWVFWTGPGISSEKVERKDFLQFSRYVNHRRIFLWDNTYTSEVDPPIMRWRTEYYDGFAEDSHGLVFNNDFAFGWGWTHQLYCLASNAYWWNPSGYISTRVHKDLFETWAYPGKYHLVKRFHEIQDSMSKGDSKEVTLGKIERLYGVVQEMEKEGMYVKRIRDYLDQTKKKTQEAK